MVIEHDRDLRGLQAAGRVVAEVLAEMAAALRPGIATAALDEIGAAALQRAGARSAPRCVYDFPGATCISVNEEAAHGIPGERVIAAGDVVNIDVSAELDGYYGDTGATFLVPPALALYRRLLEVTRRAQEAAMAVARAGTPLREIGGAIERVARDAGFTTLRDLGSHGIGRTLHEEPRFIANYRDLHDERVLVAGQVITIEPFVSTGAERCSLAGDGWTLLTGRGNRSAQFEHTLVVTEAAPLVTTRP